MNVKMLVYLIDKINDIQKQLRTTELLKGLSLVYELVPDDYSEIQKEFYKLSHPAMEGYTEKDSFEAELLGVNLVFIKKE